MSHVSRPPASSHRPLRPLWAALAAIGLASASLPALALNPRDTSVQLFQWSWNDIATECQQWLGPKGYGGVQISPPHASKVAGGWWGVYQPVNYLNLTSRMGTEAQLRSMVTACKNAGVRVYADIVVNQLADGTGTATDGSAYNGTTLSYPAFSANDFNPNCVIADSDYNSPATVDRVRNCRLGGLPDLATQNAYVQGQIVNYLVKLLQMGFDGFRIDAAKHMPPGALAQIINAVKARQPKTLSGEEIWITQEIIPDGATNRADYAGIGTINEFKYTYLMRDAFRNANGQNLASIPAAMGSWGNWGGAWGFLPPQQATVFLNNWDTERNSGDSLNASNYISGQTNDTRGTARYDLANVFMLAQGYGEAQVQSGYRFSVKDADRPTVSPYSNGVAQINVVWDFVHRWRPVSNMVKFRSVTNGHPVTNWTTGSGSQVAFSRGTKGFVALNNSTSAWSRSFATGLPAGTYCNVLTGERNAAGTGCTGDSVTVSSSGTATLNIPADGGGAFPGVALHEGQRLSSVQPPPTGTCAVTFTIANANTAWGENVHIAGNQGALGNWAPASAPKLNIQGSTANSPWTLTVALPANTQVQYKYIKRNGTSTRWEGDQATTSLNREFTTCAAGGTQSRNDGSFKF
jgi:alpha-amylase